jgi:hypothetical protein
MSTWRTGVGKQTVTLSLGMPVWATHRRGEGVQLGLVRGVDGELVDVMLSEPVRREDGSLLFTVRARHFTVAEEDEPAWALPEEGSDWTQDPRSQAKAAQSKLDEEFNRLFGDL